MSASPLSPAASLRMLGSYVYTGIMDAVKAWPYSMMILYTSPAILSITLKCLVLNGLVFLGSIGIFHAVLQPAIYHLLTWRGSQDTAQLVDTAITAIFHTLWLWPVYTLSFMLNSIWYQDIAEHAFRLHQPGASSVARRRLGIAQVLGDELYRSALLGNLFVQSMLVHFVPVLGPLASFISLAWLNSLYSFEYIWAYRGWPLEVRLKYFEKRYAYFLGFGVPSAVLTFWVSPFVGGGIFALLFPLYIIMAHNVDPLPRNDSQRLSPLIPERLPIFYVAKLLNARLIQLLQSRKSQKPGRNRD